MKEKNCQRQTDGQTKWGIAERATLLKMCKRCLTRQESFIWTCKGKCEGDWSHHLESLRRTAAAKQNTYISRPEPTFRFASLPDSPDTPVSGLIFTSEENISYFFWQLSNTTHCSSYQFSEERWLRGAIIKKLVFLVEFLGPPPQSWLKRFFLIIIFLISCVLQIEVTLLFYTFKLIGTLLAEQRASPYSKFSIFLKLLLQLYEIT